MPPSRKPKAGVGEALEDAIEDHAREGDGLSGGVAERVDRGVDVHVVQPDAAVRAAMDGDGATEAVGLLVDRPVDLRAEVVRQSERREHRADEAEVLDAAAELPDGLGGLLHGDESDAVEAGVALDVGVVEPVVVGLSGGDRPVAADDLAVGETRGGVEDGGVDADVGEEDLPSVRADERALAVAASGGLDEVPGVEVVERREERGVELSRGMVAELGREELGHRRDVLHDVAVAVDDDLQVGGGHVQASRVALSHRIFVRGGF